MTTRCDTVARFLRTVTNNIDYINNTCSADQKKINYALTLLDLRLALTTWDGQSAAGPDGTNYSSLENLT